MGKYDKEFNELKLLADSIWEKAKELLGERTSVNQKRQQKLKAYAEI